MFTIFFRSGGKIGDGNGKIGGRSGGNSGGGGSCRTS